MDIVALVAYNEYCTNSLNSANSYTDFQKKCCVRRKSAGTECQKDVALP